jgi:hypothetical protein
MHNKAQMVRGQPNSAVELPSLLRNPVLPGSNIDQEPGYPYRFPQSFQENSGQRLKLSHQLIIH